MSRALLRIQAARNVDATLAGFIASTVRMMVIGMFIIVALSRIGISITPLIAAIGGLAVGASFAMQRCRSSATRALPSTTWTSRA